MTIRNHLGDFLYAACRSDSVSHDPTLAEAMVVRWCIAQAIELGVSRPTVVSDAAIVVDCVHRKLKRADIDPIVQDTRKCKC